ncbi:hypothetical protein RB196_31675 [Streptomyces sp. PmtA]|uniref:hypothetical protein n=1 Tax=Streptomyces sp. PmtA TaxID=3074275 RepID=UPI00301451B8
MYSKSGCVWEHPARQPQQAWRRRRRVAHREEPGHIVDVAGFPSSRAEFEWWLQAVLFSLRRGTR